MAQTFYFSIVGRYPKLYDGVPTEIHQDAFIGMLEHTFGDDLQDYVFQTERGELGRYHSQCYVHSSKKYRASTLQKRFVPTAPFVSMGVKPASNAGKTTLRTYCFKERSRVLPPRGKRPIYMGRDLACMDNLLPWQKELYAMLQAPPDDRTLMWIYNEAGNVGKSKFMKWMRYRKEAVRVPMGSATQLKEAVIAKGAHRIYMVDLPRVRGKDERITEIFSALEEIKNGWVESAMHGKPKELLFEPPHVVVFSNQYPNLSLASGDRWRVFTLHDKLSQLSQNKE